MEAGEEDDGSLGRYGGTLTEGGRVSSRVPAIDDVGGFFLPQLTQFEPGMLHPPLRQPVLILATLNAAMTTSVQCQMDLRMAFETSHCGLDSTGRRSRTASGSRLIGRFQTMVDTTRFSLRRNLPVAGWTPSLGISSRKSAAVQLIRKVYHAFGPAVFRARRRIIVSPRERVNVSSGQQKTRAVTNNSQRWLVGPNRLSPRVSHAIRRAVLSFP